MRRGAFKTTLPGGRGAIAVEFDRPDNAQYEVYEIDPSSGHRISDIEYCPTWADVVRVSTYLLATGITREMQP